MKESGHHLVPVDLVRHLHRSHSLRCRGLRRFKSIRAEPVPSAAFSMHGCLARLVVAQNEASTSKSPLTNLRYRSKTGHNHGSGALDISSSIYISLFPAREACNLIMACTYLTHHISISTRHIYPGGRRAFLQAHLFICTIVRMLDIWTSASLPPGKHTSLGQSVLSYLPTSTSQCSTYTSTPPTSTHSSTSLISTQWRHNCVRDHHRLVDPLASHGPAASRA